MCVDKRAQAEHDEAVGLTALCGRLMAPGTLTRRATAADDALTLAAMQDSRRVRIIAADEFESILGVLRDMLAAFPVAGPGDDRMTCRIRAAIRAMEGEPPPA